MTFWIPKHSRKQLAVMTAEADHAEGYDAWIAERERAAANGENVPEFIMAGDVDHTMQFSWDFSQGWQDRAYKRLRERKNRREPHTPEQYIQHEDGTLERSYAHEIDLLPFERGEACVNCGEWQPEDVHERKRLLRRLEDMVGPRPAGRKVEETCCYCGNHMVTQKYAA